jgi:hypothetical protein
LKFARSKETVPTSEGRPSLHLVPKPGRSGGAEAKDVLARALVSCETGDGVTAQAAQINETAIASSARKFFIRMF